MHVHANYHKNFWSTKYKLKELGTRSALNSDHYYVTYRLYGLCLTTTSLAGGIGGCVLY